MRPTKLTVSAFGPYADKIVFDMERLGKEGIYLITGDTGAGKTTVFDAIVFALYGTASGKARSDDLSLLRSRYADPEVPTFVELEFEYRGKQYRIKRNPEYLRPSKRGDGMTVEKAGVEFLLPDGTVITKNKETGARIEEILGLDRDQFMQIAMIAQGEFQKLIYAETADRRKIFRKIFGTELYQEFQDALKQETAAVRKTCDELRRSTSQYIAGIVYGPDDSFACRFESAKNGEMLISDVLILIEEMVKRDRMDLEEYISFRSKSERALSELSEMIGKAEEKERLQRQLENLKPQLSIYTEKEEKATVDFLAEQEKEPQRTALSRQIALQENTLSEYDELEQLNEQMFEHQKILKKWSEQQQTFSEKADLLKNLLCSEKEEASGLKNTAVVLTQLKQNLDALKKQKIEFETFENQFRETASVKIKYDKAARQYVAASQKAQQEKQRYEIQYKQYLDEQAGVLAETLKPGQKCPVCGSLHHPEPAVTSAGAPTKEALEHMKESASASEHEAALKSEKAAALKARLEEKEQALRKAQEALSISCGFDRLSEKIRTRMNENLSRTEETKKEVLQAEAKVKRHAELEKLIPIHEEELQTIQNQYAEAEKEAAAVQSALEAFKMQHAKKTASLMFPDKAEAEQSLIRLRTEFTQMQTALSAAEKKKTEITAKVQELSGSIRAVSAQLEYSAEYDTESLKNRKAELSEEMSRCAEAADTLSYRVKTNTEMMKHIAAHAEHLKEAEAKYQWMQALSDTVSGNISGKQKVNLETYVQMRYFERIINRANIRLLEMTGGQYELKLRKEDQKLKAQSGLELDVTDHYNGTERSVKTLSGGESFKASLSLALGLSDEIQSAAGGIRLDTMFIDEGFGSLDDESLRQAIRTLEDLSEGSRLIGMISHVGELKNRIDRQIVITKEKSGGSRAEIIGAY